MKEYLRCEDASSLLKFELKFADLIANYRRKYTGSFCKRCGFHEELIERLLDCPNFYQKPKIEKACNSEESSQSSGKANKIPNCGVTASKWRFSFLIITIRYSMVTVRASLQIFSSNSFAIQLFENFMSEC